MSVPDHAGLNRLEKAALVKSALFALGGTSSGVYAHVKETPGGCRCEACEACRRAFQLLGEPAPLEPDPGAACPGPAALQVELAALTARRLLTWAQAKEVHAELDRIAVHEADLRDRLRTLARQDRQKEKRRAQPAAPAAPEAPTG